MDSLCSWPEFSDDWYLDEMIDSNVNEDEKLRKEIEQWLGEDYKQDEDEDEGEEEVGKESTTCKQYGVGKVLIKAPLIKKLGEDEDEDEKLRKEIEELLGEDYKQDEDEGEEEVEMESTTCKQYGAGKVLKYGVGKVLKAPLIKKLGEDEDEDDESKADSPKKKRRLAELSKEEYESKMRATQAKLRQSYQQTLPKRHSKFVDVEPSKKSAGANNMNPRKKPSTTGTVHQRITTKLQALKSKKATR